METGYSIQEDVLPDSDCDVLLSVLASESVSRSRAGARHLMKSRSVAALASDVRLLEIAREYVGPSCIPFRATLFEKSSQTNWLIPWHQDTALPITVQRDAPGWGPWSNKSGVIYAHAPAAALSRVIALRVHLDPSTEDNGPLRVIPGSHRSGVLSDDDVAVFAAAHRQQECVVSKGGVIAMRPLLIHASSKARNTDPRRVLHIEYADSLQIGDGMQLAVV